MERHKTLRSISRHILALPLAKPTVRVIVRFAMCHLPLSPENRMRLFRFFSEDTTPSTPVDFQIRIPVQAAARQKLKLQLSLEDEMGRAWYYGGYKVHEPGTARCFSLLLHHKNRVFDIGANVGYYTLLASAVLEERGEVYSFEPSDQAFHWLEHNARLNAFSCLHLQQKAMSDQNGPASFFLPLDQRWTHASIIEGFMEQNGCVTVEAVRFDTFCTQNHLQPVDLIKMDVEGAEIKVLHGMGDLLDQWRPDIILEVLEPYEQELNRFFTGTPYRKFLITRHGIEEVEHIKADLHLRDYYLSCNPILPLQF